VARYLTLMFLYFTFHLWVARITVRFFIILSSACERSYAGINESGLERKLTSRQQSQAPPSICFLVALSRTTSTYLCFTPRLVAGLIWKRSLNAGSFGLTLPPQRPPQ
jgi:hypothetical protein